MSRADIIEGVAVATGLRRVEVHAVLEGILKYIEEELSRGGEVQLRRFGTFRCVKRASRQGINPRTLERIEVAERTVPVFKPARQLRENCKNVKL